MRFGHRAIVVSTWNMSTLFAARDVYKTCTNIYLWIVVLLLLLIFFCQGYPHLIPGWTSCFQQDTARIHAFTYTQTSMHECQYGLPWVYQRSHNYANAISCSHSSRVCVYVCVFVCMHILWIFCLLPCTHSLVEPKTNLSLFNFKLHFCYL